MIIINNNIYDVTNFAKVHAGGFLPLYHSASNDVTDLFTEYHSKDTFNLLHKYKVGYLSTPNYPSNLEFIKEEIMNVINIQIDFVNLVYKEKRKIDVNKLNDIEYYNNVIIEAVNIYTTSPDKVYLNDIIPFSEKLPKV